ncbi:hypothetical protein [Cytobacillus firmus]|uniref:hypothetical protein n=1 Tax=Cytobacillus firmus TaxID=1399 RepID=UPI0024C1C846|nr:hypothetical protein [Cytobacillus firmus]WHY63646.1 hypothetical protein QNH42_09865 [Cytobacillus firmus]
MVLKMILVVIALIIIGLIKELRALLRVVEDIDFLSNYNGTYVDYMNNYLGKRYDTPKEKELHIKLISEAPKAQRLLLDAGLVDYQPAFRGYMVKNYPILVNTVQSLRNPSSLTEEFNWVNTILIMQIARYKELHESIKGNVLNPLVLLREGVQFFVTLPISLLYWTGVIQYSTQYKLSNNIVVKFLNFLIISIGFVSAIVTIVLGWEQFKSYLDKFL